MNHSAQPAADLSALMDGELGPQYTAALVQAVAQDAQLQAAWQRYQLIGEALRAGASLGVVGQDSLQGIAGTRVHALPMTPSATPYTQAANDSVWRWKLAAGFAAVAAVGSIVWSVTGQGGSATQTLAGSPSPAMATTALISVELNSGQSGTMIRDPRLDELMAAHKQFGSASALQPAGFLRSASFQAAQR